MKNFKATAFSILGAIVLSFIIAILLGENPTAILNTMGHSIFGNFDQFSYVLFYTTPLIFTGLSVAVAFHAGLFNIGSEGQLYIGSLFTTFFTLTFLNLPSVLAILGAILFAFLGGGLWAAIAGFLKAQRGSHEVIVTIMLNFISYAVCGFFILGALKNPNSQNPESAEIGIQYHLHRFHSEAPLNLAFFLAILCAVFIWILLYKTNWGLEVRLIGSSAETARRSGVNIKRRLIEAMFLSGGLAGLVGVNEILGHAYKFKDQFSNGLGFVGIAVALLARNRPIMVLFSALLFGALSKSALDLELDTEKITRDMALVIQGLIILFVAASQGEKMLLDDLILSAIRISLPLIFAAYGGMLSEKSGVANIALEAYLLFSSFCAAAIMALTHNLAFSILAGLLGGLFIGIIFSFFTVKTKSDQIIVGMALNILATGLIPVLCKAFYGTSGQTPSLEIQDRVSSTAPFIVTAILVFIFIFILFKKSVFGLRIIAAGDHPPALRSQGVNVDFIRVRAILLGAAIASLGGIYLSLGAGSGYTRNMSAGRGFIALSALIFGRWKPLPTLLACLFFGFFDSLQIFLQNTGGIKIPTQFVQVLPYLLTLILLAAPTGKTKRNFAPQAINQPDL